MMKKTTLLLWLISCAYLLHAQEITEPKIKFGEFNLADLEMKFYEKDSSANALVLYDYGQTSFDDRLGTASQRFIYHTKIKILRKSALNLGTISLQLVKGGLGREQVISNIKGFTYNVENGSVTREKLAKESIFIEKAVGGIQNVKITMPNVKEGSVIEYSYMITTPFTISWNPPTWIFQGVNPVMWSICEIIVPPHLHYGMLMSGYLELTSKKEELINEKVDDFYLQGLKHRFILKDVPAFRNEAYITNLEDYISKIDFVLERGMGFSFLPSDYSNMNRALLQSEFLSGQLKKTGFLKEVAVEIKSKYSDSTARLKAACDYVQKNVKWNEGFSIYSRSVKKALEDHIGDSGDINLLLVALLREIGFDTNPVILGTRGNGRIDEKYVIMKRFNYVVAHIKRNGKDFLMDATDKYLKLGMLPVHCLNGLGWLIHSSNGGFVQIIPTEKDAEFKTANLVIDKEGELKGSFTKSYNGYSALIEKRNFKDKGQEKYLEEDRKANANWVIEKADYISNDSPDAAMSAEYQITLNDYITKAGNVLYLKPMLSEGKKENLLKAKERLYPIDFVYPQEETFMATYEIPKDYSIVEIPKKISLTLPKDAGRFTYSTLVNENKITLTSRIQFHKALYHAEEYPFLREFFDKIVAKHNEQIVLKKN